MRFHRKGKEQKAKHDAYRKESREHKWVLYVLGALAALLSVYFFFTQGAMSLGTYAALLFLLMWIALVADFLHKRNLKMLKLVVAVFCASMLGGLVIGGLSQAVQPVSAYTFANGQITSSNGAITVIIPYITPPSTSFASSLIPTILPITIPGFNVSPISWLEDNVINIGIGVVNAVIYIANLVIGATIDLIGGVVDLPVYLFDSVSVTTLGPVVDFLSFIPASGAWIAAVVVWAIAITEWTLIIIVLIRLARTAIGATTGVLETDESSLEEETGALT